MAAETSAAEESVEGVSLTVTFDGETCIYDGPTELSAGDVTLTLVNQSNRTSYVELAKLQDGVTFEDVVAAHSPEPYNGPRSGDLYLPLEFDQPQAYAGDEGSVSGVVDAGNYALVCLQRGNQAALAWVVRPGGVSVTD